MSDTFIHTENLCFSYVDNEGKKESPALRGISVDIKKGEYVAVLGHNGSGKSTFAKLLNLILEPTGGRLVIDGVDLTEQELTDEVILQLRRKVGMVFQNPDNQLVATIVEEDVAFGPENLGIPSNEIRIRVDEALEAVGMSQFAKNEPHRLSGGQKQRIAIAGVIAMMPRCIIFDESTAMLDPSGRREVLDAIKMLNTEFGITVINITHYMNEAALADRVLVINDGQLLLDGTPDEIFEQHELLTSVGLEVPQCTQLIHSLRALGIDLEGSEISTPESCADQIVHAYLQRKEGGADRG